ncbi:hypothetical protein IV498_07030 [Paenarthrobacter sp. Z7-10]|uniref:hypothetical protein n=1 Tax=Paenarthrobacter sp. Z7-10 TaxID=2787635 RepID=UPI0022A9833A|nr:hypothetical protein [Paenarthrobacter sp. Z7-10]MCZ2402943.1 hypothetical protein [Paenarthrobacter sp. Z7-10]
MSVLTSQQPRSTESSPERAALTRPESRTNSWPLMVLLLGYPLWWILGLSDLLPLALAVPMLRMLLRNRPVRLPRGTGWFLLFMLWVIVSGVALWADAPGAVPGGGPERLLVFAYRLAWYAACAIAFLWIANARENSVSTLRVTRLLGWMFVVTVAGGLLGIVAPTFQITSMVEALLPRSLASNSFLQTLVHPAAANMTTFLGRVEYRPIAPFDFANSWGSNLSLYLPFFLLTWFGKRAGWRRVCAPIVLAASAWPIVYSMNRGLWISLGAGAVVVLIYLILKGRGRILLVVVATLGIAVALFISSPLATRSSDTIDSAHSDDRRGTLLTQTVASTVEGSPILGFGSTRNVQGSFASIAGGSTPDCPACSVPPLGTQGHLWLVIFSQGLVGAFFFVMFFLSRIWVHWRSRNPLELAGATILLFFFIQMFVYDTLGMPLFTIMIALGLVWRERSRIDGVAATSICMADFSILRRRYLPFLLACTLAGGTIGTAMAATRPTSYAAEVTLLLAPAPVYLASDGTEDPKSGQITIDTEAALVLSRRTMELVDGSLKLSDPDALRSRIRISAAPNTQVLTLGYSDASSARALSGAKALAEAYLGVRGEGLAQRRDQVLRALQEQLARLESTKDPTTTPITANSQVRFAYIAGVAERLRSAIDNLSISTTAAGEVIRPANVSKVRGQPEVDIASSALIGFLLAAALVVTVNFIRVHGGGGIAGSRRVRSSAKVPRFRFARLPVPALRRQGAPSS